MMLESRFILRAILTVKNLPIITSQNAGMKYFPPPRKYEGIEFPERPKLKVVDRVPTYPAGIRPPKMQKRLRYMRGPELVHTELLHKQYAIIATGGGRMRWEHFELIRLAITRKIDVKRMFAIWRIDPPWQPVTKKGQGQRMGGGKGAIDHYVTPIKAGRVIVEMGGYCEFAEVQSILQNVGNKLPLAIEVVSQEMLDKRKAKEERLEKLNLNKWSFEYIVKNNMGGCANWISPVDRIWFGKYR